MQTRSVLTPALLVALGALGACTSTSRAPGEFDPAPEPEPTGPEDPRLAEVLLPAASDDWQASLVIDNGETGIWAVESFPVFEQYAVPEIVGLDNRGRAIICVSYSGKWTPYPVIEDGKWLAAMADGDLDARIDGAELYVGGQLGNLYQIVPYPNGALDYRLIARFPGREIHTLIGGEVDAGHAGPELIVFTRPGGLFRVTADGPDGRFRSEHLEELGGRVRDAVVLPASPDDPTQPPQIATVSRAGWLKLLTLTKDGPVWETIHEDSMGMGRLSLAPKRAGADVVLYSTHDDGRILRHERHGKHWTTDVIYISDQGPRGVAAGHFDPDPSVETVAIFGYGKKVELLRRTPEGMWAAETLFEDRDKGHWLAHAELDGRNNTDELILSGYGSRIVLLSHRAP